MSLLLANDEVAFLAAHLRRLTQWDERTAVRLQRRGDAVGLYAAPPLGVLTLVVVPLAPGSTLEQGFDRVVSAGRLRDVLGSVTPDDGTRTVNVPDAVLGSASLGMLPPREGWFPPVTAMAGDLVGEVDESIAEIGSRTAGTIEPFARQIAEEVWSRTGWATLPLRVLHAARQLGFLGHPGARIQASVNGPWKRLVSPAGQVFVHAPATAVPLRVVR